MSDSRLTTWSFATFHVALFVVAAVLFLYSRGGFGATLASLNTLLGLGLFIALWATTFFTTRRAFRGLDLADAAALRLLPRRAIRWGAANGVAFLALLAIPLIVGAIAAARPGGNPLAPLGFAVIASPFALSVAAVVGALVGLVLSLVDLVLIAAARWMVR